MLVGMRKTPDGGRVTVAQLLDEARAGLDRLSPVEAHTAAARGALLVDVRSELQRDRDGTVPGARFFPRNAIEWRADPASSSHDPVFADQHRQVIVMCDEGYQSSLVAATLQRLGFARATDVVGGFQAWRAHGLPLDGGRTAVSAG
jgi:rhodanese-related sulfurtransferase